MSSEIVSIIGPGGKYARVNSKGEVLFDLLTENADTNFEISKPDDRFMIRNVRADLILGADATQFDPTIGKQFYAISVDKRGNYESWFIGKTPSGLIVAFIEYINQGVLTAPFTSASLTIKRKI